MLGKFATAASVLVSVAVHAGTPSFTAPEGAVMRHLLADDIATWGPNTDTLLKPTLVVVTADSLQREYERNEVAGDRAYQGKALLVVGTVRSIDRSIGKNYFISLKGGSNPYMTPRAMMADGHEDYLASLNKGQNIKLVCQGSGMLVGSASLNKCHPIQTWATDQARAFVAAAPARVAAGNQEAIQIASAGIAMASMLPPSSPCFVDEAGKHDACMAELGKLDKAKGSAAKFKVAQATAAERMGVQLRK